MAKQRSTPIALHENGVLERYGVELIGASIEAIQRGENRSSSRRSSRDSLASQAARPRWRAAGSATRSKTFCALRMILVIRWWCGPASPWVAGSGLAYNEADLRRMAGAGLSASPTSEVLIEESILGWKEYELEVMRDKADNVVIVCSIENLDPMGVHTGDSITVAPAMTLTDREYQRMRDVAIGIIRAVGVDTGGCNIQFAINPADGRMIVIEMNRGYHDRRRSLRRQLAFRLPRSPRKSPSATPSTRFRMTSPSRTRRASNRPWTMSWSRCRDSHSKSSLRPTPP